MRFRYYFVVQDAEGNVVSNAAVSVYLAGTSMPAVVYATRTSSQGNSTPPQLYSRENGSVMFWLDSNDYSYGQLFDIVVRKGDFSLVLRDVQIIVWDAVRADTVDGFHASLTPAPNVIVPLDGYGVLDLSASYVKSNVYTFRRINGNDLTSDYSLAVGEEVFYNWNTEWSLNLPLRIRTSGGIYQIIINAPYNTSKDCFMFLYPNNSAYSNAFTFSAIFCTDGVLTPRAYSAIHSFFEFERLGSGGLANILCSTYTDRKFLILKERITRYTENGGEVLLISSRWNDTIVPWTSLGTLGVSSANGIIYVLIRRLV